MERPKNLTARAITWSNYKHNNTIKYLIGTTPAGAISFLLKGWGGRVSDKMITMEYGFLGKLGTVFWLIVGFKSKMSWPLLAQLYGFQVPPRAKANYLLEMSPDHASFRMLEYM